MIDARTFRFAERFRTFRPEQIAEEHTGAGRRRYHLDVMGDGASDLSFTDPDFSVRCLRTNAVRRWEYSPGSTLFVVRSQGRSSSDPEDRSA
ncbi:hypothetical protein BH23GEM7_BH23GEM7_23900 [soil metagenome]|nr:hypothetical protein [Gemmatimonadota bacterium]